MKNKHDLSIESLNKQLAQDKDLPLIAYWKLALLQIQNEADLHSYLLMKGRFQDEEINHIQGEYIGAEIIRKFYIEKDPLSLVLKIHLLIENFINEILSHNKIAEDNMTFKKKIDVLKSKKLIKEYIYSNVRVLNNLRNSYAHDYSYDISNFSLEEFSYAKNFYDGLKCKKSTRAILNLKSFQFQIIILLLEDLLIEYPYLTKRKLKKITNWKFYETTIGDKIGCILDKVDQETKNSPLKWGLSLEVVDTSNTKKDDKKINKFGPLYKK